MNAYLSNRVADLLVAKDIIPAEKYDIYVYGSELIISDVINFCIILAVSGLLHRFETGVIFLFCFVPTRQFSGGYHASTHGRCRCAFLFAFLFLLLGSELIFLKNIILICLLNITSLLTFWKLAPIENPNKPLTPTCRGKNRQRALVSAVLLSIVSIVLCVLGRKEGVVVNLTLFIIASLMIIENEKRR